MEGLEDPLPNRWTDAEKLTIVCAYGTAKVANPTANEKQLVAAVRAVLPRDLRDFTVCQVRRWVRASPLQAQHGIVELAAALQPWLSASGRSASAAFMSKGMQVISCIVTELAKDASLRAVLLKAVENGVERFASSFPRTGLTSDLPSVLTLGIGVREVMSLARQFGGTLIVRHWKNEDSLQSLLNAVVQADFVAIHGRVSTDAQRVISAASTHLPLHLGSLADLQSMLTALAIAPRALVRTTHDGVAGRLN